MRALDSSSSWLCVGEPHIQQVHKTGHEIICGRHEAAATGNRKRDDWTSSWEYVCSGVIDFLGF